MRGVASTARAVEMPNVCCLICARQIVRVLEANVFQRVAFHFNLLELRRCMHENGTGLSEPVSMLLACICDFERGKFFGAAEAYCFNHWSCRDADVCVALVHVRQCLENDVQCLGACLRCNFRVGGNLTLSNVTSIAGAGEVPCFVASV